MALFPSVGSDRVCHCFLRIDRDNIVCIKVPIEGHWNNRCRPEGSYIMFEVFVDFRGREDIDLA